jgi:hypothetical protein
MEAPSFESGDLLTLARSRVRIGSVPDWVTAATYSPEFTAKVRRAVTPLLLERQAHAELHEHHVHNALRLETIPAVQHHSQWRLEFAPKTEWVVLHTVRTRRGAVEREHLSLEKIQFLQREAGLEGFIIDGGITLLLLLEDVAVGDVLEFSYTIRSQPRLLPQNWGMLFELPLASEIGKHHFSVRHAATRQMKWKSYSQSLAPVVTVRKARIGGNLVTPHSIPAPESSRSVHLAQPFQGCGPLAPQSQGSLASSATLGFEAESLRDSLKKVHGDHAGSSNVEPPREPLTPTLSPSDGEREKTTAHADEREKNAALNDEVELVWQGENVVTLEPEEGTPASEILYPWMQFSDCPDWQMVARAVAEAWPQQVQGDGLNKLLEEIRSASPELTGQVNQAIKTIQDGFRYLSVNVEYGGQIPAEPETVIRRRYGDCKDLALLLCRLLRGRAGSFGATSVGSYEAAETDFPVPAIAAVRPRDCRISDW